MLNNDCLYMILTFINVKDLITCFIVDKTFYKIAHDNLLWKNHINPLWMTCQSHFYNHYKHSFILQKNINSNQAFSSIKNLRVDFTHFVISPQLCQLITLKHLDLSNNKITTIPYEFGNLIHLNTLHLNYNEITTLPREFEQLTKLQFLYLQGNLLNKVPPEIEKLIGRTKSGRKPCAIAG